MSYGKFAERMTVLALMCVLASAAYAELTDIEVGGMVRLRFRSFENSYDTLSSLPPKAERIPLFFLPQRAIGPFGTKTNYDWNTRGNDRNFVEESTKINVRADFTNDVSSFIEFKTYHQWGKDFRSNYITGLDIRGYETATAFLYQGYIETRNTFGYPVTLRLGRQELHLGKGWLIGSRFGIQERTYDGVRATYSDAPITVDALAMKLSENSPVEQDGDTDLYGVYGTYAFSKALSASAYWLLIRDGSMRNDTNFAWFPEYVEDAFGVDDYDPTTMHTIGMRLWGAVDRVDYDLELAYQFGAADSVGSTFKTATYGDDSAEYGHLAGDLEIGYRFDIKGQPRVFIGGAYFGGEDHRSVSLWNWVNPFDTAQASVSFNRLFPDVLYTELLDNHRGMTNFNQIRVGASAKPFDKVTTELSVQRYEANARFDRPRSFNVGRFSVPIAPALSFWTEKTSGDLGYLTDFSVRYDYDSSLYFKLSWQHLFTGAGMGDGNFIFAEGLQFSGGTDRDDADYIAFDTAVTF